MNYNVEIDLSFIGGALDIDRILTTLPAAPDIASKKGSRDAARITPRNNLISFRSKAASWEAGLEEHWSSMSGMISKNYAHLVALGKISEAKVTIIVDHRGRFPALFMPKDFVQFASDIGAIIDVDVYEENMDVL